MRGYVLHYKIWMLIIPALKISLYIFHHVDAQGDKVNNVYAFMSTLSRVVRKIKRNLSHPLKKLLLKESKASKLGRKHQKKHCSNLHEMLVGL